MAQDKFLYVVIVVVFGTVVQKIVVTFIWNIL